MHKTVYRLISVVITFVLTVGLYSPVKAIPSSNNKPSQTSGTPRVYAYYYLWWSAQHWKNKLGPNYPYNASPLPLPATTDTDGCNAVTKYVGNQLIDVPSKLVSQDDPGAIEADIRLAKNAGLTGFWLNWNGDGTTTQTRTTVTYTRRLAEAFTVSSRVGGFKNWVSYKAASMPSATVIINDLNFLYREFKDEPAWERINGKLVVTFTGSRKYSNAAVQQVSNAVRDRIYLVGDETRTTLTTTRIAMFDAITYYWSSQDPYGNPQSFAQIKEMGDKVHAAGKDWYAPLAPGYNSKLLNGSGNCVPRRNGDTIRTLWNGNSNSKPDGWGFISWNEIAENTHIKPMQKWGNKPLDILASLIGSAAQPLPVTATPTKVNSPTSTPIVPTPTLPGPTATVPSTNTFDDTNPAFAYSSSAWQSIGTTNAYNGSYKETTTDGSFVTFSFIGQSFSLIYKGGITYSKFDIYVDEVLTGTLDQKMTAATYQQRWDYPGQLATGSHILKLVFKVTSSTVNKGSLDAVIVR